MENLAEKLLFPAPTTTYNAFSFPAELLWFPVNQENYSSAAQEDYGAGLLLEAKSSRYLIIYFHSNAEDIATTYKFSLRLRSTFESTIFSVELPGYGICPGPPSQAACAKVAKAALRFVTNILNWPIEDVIIMGRSLGTYLALEAAENQLCAGVILVSPFATIRSTVSHHIGILSNFVSEDLFNNEEIVKSVPSKLVIIHGTQDKLVPISESERIFKNAPNPFQLFTPDIDHNADLFRCSKSFILPIHSTFPLPDYKFDRTLTVPAEAYDRRLGGVRFVMSNTPLNQPRGDDWDDMTPLDFKQIIKNGEPLCQPNGDLHGMDVHEDDETDDIGLHYDETDSDRVDIDFIQDGINVGIDRFIEKFGSPIMKSPTTKVHLVPKSPVRHPSHQSLYPTSMRSSDEMSLHDYLTGTKPISLPNTVVPHPSHFSSLPDSWSGGMNASNTSETTSSSGDELKKMSCVQEIMSAEEMPRVQLSARSRRRTPLVMKMKGV